MLSLGELNRALGELREDLRWLPVDREELAIPQASVGFGLAISDAAREESLQVTLSEQQRFAASAPPPPQVDWRDMRGQNWVTPVRAQKTCGACIAFATCAVLESRLQIAQDDANLGVDLAEADLFFCGCGRCCKDGWTFCPALTRCKEHGVGYESDFPYTAHDQGCKEIAPRVGVKSWGSAVSADARRRAVAEGPVIAGMKVFEDFLYYKSGVYRHVTGDLLGLHAVAVIGFDDKVESWIVKNSWSSLWGDGGFVHLAYGQCGIDTDFPFYDPEVIRWTATA